MIANVYETIKDIYSLPKAFSVVAGCLPIVKAIFKSARRHIDAVRDEAVCKGIKYIVEQCEANTNTLKGIFEEVKPDNSAWKVERYYKAVKTIGKGSKVETLMTNILKDIQFLNSQHGMETATEHQQKEILAGSKDSSEVLPSIPDSEFHDPGVMMSQYGSRTQQYTAQGNSYAGSGAPMFNGGDHQTIHYSKG
jgi:hypothetical protein